MAAETAGGAVGRRARVAAAQVALGKPLAEAMLAVGEDPVACAIVRAGEQAGRLPVLARQLAESYRLRARLRDDIVGRMVYPTILVHFALVVLPLPWVMSGKLAGWTMVLGPGLLWLSIGLTMAIAWWTGRAGLLARLALRAPCSALCWPALAADLMAVLRAAIGAGMLAPAALELAAGSCANRLLAERVMKAAADLRQGRSADLSAALEACGVRGDLLEIIRVGETSGKLEEAFGQARTIAAERFIWRLQWTARITTGTAYAIAMLVAAGTVLTMYSAVLSQAAEGLEQ